MGTFAAPAQLNASYVKYQNNIDSNSLERAKAQGLKVKVLRPGSNMANRERTR